MASTASLLYPSHFRLRLEGEGLKRIGARQYRVHKSPFFEQVHAWLHLLRRPSSRFLFQIARIIEPLSGRKRGNCFVKLALRIHAFILAAMWGTLTLATSPLFLPLHVWAHRKRFSLQMIRPERDAEIPEGPLHIRTHNIAQGPESFVALTDLRPNRERAEELVSSILEDPNAPHFLLFQEAYNQTEVLTKLKDRYPYIIHSVAPDALGLSSGFFVASQYPIEQVEFRAMPMEWPEAIIGRGALKVRISTPEGGKLDIFGVHLQALLGKKRADRRLEQLESLYAWMKEEYEGEEIPQLLIGDLNTSSITAWGEDNEDPKQPEHRVLEFFRSRFSDCFAEEHNPITGERMRGEPHFLTGDNRKMGVELPEPKGSWYHGPFADPGIGLKVKQLWDRIRYRYPAPRLIRPIQIPPDWGTQRWHQSQEANTARFDYIAKPLYCQNRFESIATEIRRIAVASSLPSAPSDHLPVDSIFTLVGGARPPAL